MAPNKGGQVGAWTGEKLGASKVAQLGSSADGLADLEPFDEASNIAGLGEIVGTNGQGAGCRAHQGDLAATGRMLQNGRDGVAVAGRIAATVIDVERWRQDSR